VNKTNIPHQLQIQLIFEPTSNYNLYLYLNYSNLTQNGYGNLMKHGCTRTPQLPISA